METQSDKTENVHQPQTEVKHPTQWERDLNPNYMQGQNIGQRSADMEQGVRTAYDHKDVHRTLSHDFTDDELKQIPIVPLGQALQQGGTYLDLKDSARQEFTAIGSQVAGENNWYVPKDQVPYSLWNRLTGVQNPERVAERRSEDLR